ncbi:AraC family transcriptional regulator [Thermomonospora umbrina]|uniref:AraC family transcriptional regulator n=1 Tax=Thermomonospora umbrina TaxID=111806 RepID=A0A3D9SZ46_9ACTN|nr:AraC family transcriptional regulator [Thermomonospora umbrina]REE99830.1 AraC family transcriptional regulator [Thermomonospora umbrina]
MTIIDTGADGDLLDALLDPLRLRGVFASRWTVHAPWGVRGGQENCAVLHHVRTGVCTVTLPGSEPLVLRPGDLAIFPHGTPHELADRPGRATMPLDALVPGREAGTARVVRVDGPGPVTELLCGGLHYDGPAVTPLYRVLPDVLVLDREMLAGEPLLAGTLDRLADGMEQDAPGGRLVALRAFELVFVLALRVALHRSAGECPALESLRHPSIGRALLAVQTRFAEPWTLESLAREAGMSRSSFAATFRRLVGEAPARHLAARRMQEAARLLTETAVPLGGVAERVGYASAVGFHLAFRRHHGVTPGEYRRARATATHGARSEG